MTCIPWAGDTGVPSGQGVGTNLVVWLLGRVPGALCTPCHSLPSPGAWSSLPDLLQTRWGQGWVVQLCSCRKGLGSGGRQGGHGQPVGPLHLWPCSLGNPQGLDTGETLESPQTLSLL